MGGKIIGAIIETVAKYNRAINKPYQNVRHVMTKECEILVPNEFEEYIFRLDEKWKITYQNDKSITIKRN